MVGSSLANTVAQRVAPALLAAGYEIVACTFRANDGVLQLFVDHCVERAKQLGLDVTRSAITLSDCEAVSKLVSDIVDAEGLMDDAAKYELEVSSPGAERPLVQPRDYQRYVGAPVRVVVRAQMDAEGQATSPQRARRARTVDAVLVAANEDGVRLRLGSKKGAAEQDVPFTMIERARLRLLP